MAGLAPEEEMICEYIQSGKNGSIDQISKALNLPRVIVESACDYLEREGYVSELDPPERHSVIDFTINGIHSGRYASIPLDDSEVMEQVIFLSNNHEVYRVPITSEPAEIDLSIPIWNVMYKGLFSLKAVKKPILMIDRIVLKFTTEKIISSLNIPIDLSGESYEVLQIKIEVTKNAEC